MKHPFEYEIIYSSRKTIAIQVTRDGRVLVRSPPGAVPVPILMTLSPTMKTGC